MEIRSGSARHLIIIGFVGALLAACGGGGGSSNDAPPTPPAADTQAPTAKINFPTAQALTTADNITVTGTATDAEGNVISSVTVNVNGTATASTSTNEFANWTASVSLIAGNNTITIETTDNKGNIAASADSITIKNEVALLNPNDIVLDSTSNRALLVDEVLRAVIAVDLTSGQRSVVSDAEQGSGTLFDVPSTIVLDSANSRVLVGDGTQIIAVDLATGNRSPFSDLGSAQVFDVALDESNARLLVVTTNGVLTVPVAGGASSDFSSAMAGTGPPFNSPASIVVDTTGNRALVTDSAVPAVIAVDLSNGNRTSFASAGDTNGVDLQTPLGITLNSGASEALVTDLGSATVAPMIVSINLASQARTLVSAGGSTPTGSGLDFSFPVAIIADGNRNIVVDPALAAVLSVDASNGNRNILSSASVGGGIEFNGPFNIEYDASNNRALVTDNSSGAIYTVNLDTGARDILSGGGVGSGDEFEFPLNLAVGGSQAFVTDSDAASNTASVLAVDLNSGDRTILASDVGADANKSPLGLALDSSSNTLYVSVIELDASQALSGSELFSLPTNSSTATPIALSGGSLAFAQNLIINSEAGTALVADTVNDALFAVTLAGGAASNLGPITNTVPTGIAPFQDLTLMGNETVLVDSSLASVVGIDNSSGARRVISDGATGNGALLQSPTGVTYISDRNILLVVDRFSFAVFAIDPTSGDRVIISR